MTQAQITYLLLFVLTTFAFVLISCIGERIGERQGLSLKIWRDEP